MDEQSDREHHVEGVVPERQVTRRTHAGADLRLVGAQGSQAQVVDVDTNGA